MGLTVKIFTLFPEAFDALRHGLIGKAIEVGLIGLETVDIRQFSEDRHGKVDDLPYGGGPGMVMKPEPVFRAAEAAYGNDAEGIRAGREPLILLSPQGEPFSDGTARRLAAGGGFGLICGHYEGVDERVRLGLANEEISVGDYVLSGGEPAAVVLIDAVARYVPGVIGNAESVEADTFSDGILKGPQYTRPRSFRGMDVPEVLLSGDHARIEDWRRERALEETRKRRPDLLDEEA